MNRTVSTEDLPYHRVMSQVSGSQNSSDSSTAELTTSLARIERLHAAIRDIRYNQPLEALSLLEQSLELSQRAGYLEGEACSLLLAGLTRAQLGATALALALEERGLRCFERASADAAQPRSGELRLALSIIFSLRGRLEEAYLTLIELIEIAREQRNRLWEAYALHDMALTFQSFGDAPAALEYMFECVKIQREAEDKPADIAFSLINLGTMYLGQNEISRGVACFDEALQLSRGIGDTSSEARALLNLAEARHRRREDELAQASCLHAQALYEQINDSPNVGACHDFLCRLRATQGKPAEALAHFERATPLVTPDLSPEAAGRRKILLVRLQLMLNPEHDTEEILGGLQAALETSRQTGTKPLEQEALLGLADFYESRQEFELALTYFKAAREVERALFNDASDRLAKSLSIQFETERVTQNAASQRERNLELQNLNAALERSDAEKAALLEKLQQHNLQLERLSQRDPLTGLYNRRALEERFQALHERVRLHGQPLCVAVADIDHFKQVNDRHSHGVGDEVLRVIAQIMLEACRGADLVSRHGGEEFVMILPDTGAEQGVSVCERIRGAVERFDWERVQPGLRVTISLGMVCAQDASDLRGLLAGADERMYAAKRAGRNRVVT